MQSRMYKRDIFGDDPYLVLDFDLCLSRPMTSFDPEYVRELKIDMYQELIDALGAEMYEIKEEIHEIKKNGS